LSRVLSLVIGLKLSQVLMLIDSEASMKASLLRMSEPKADSNAEVPGEKK